MGLPKSTCAALCLAWLLTGCTPDQPVTSPAGKSAQATAPNLQPAGPTPPSRVQAAKPGVNSTPNNPHNQRLIDAAETAYASGIQNYRTGKLEAAKADFDRAVDLMLSSDLDLKNDPQLSEEFEHLVDAVNTLEMDALKQGNGFAPKVEPAPVDVANDVTFPVDPNLKAQAEAELKTTQSDLPLVVNDYVASYINYFSSRGKVTLERSLVRAGRYHDMIARILVQEGVPQDLIYQAVAETGFQPQSVNPRTGAGGMWQFMPYGGYGLTRNGWYDERLDPEKSTRAYARYMKSLYNQLGDWYLAMAAYDWGPGSVQRAVQRTGYADFWELYRRNVLPQETKNYVPIILAAAIMAKNPQQYGLTVTPDPAMMSDVITTSYRVDLRLVADVVEAPVQEIIALNPSLLRMSTPADAPFELHLPAGSKGLYEKRIAEVPEDKRASWRFHKLAPGETLEAISRSYHVSPSEIAFVNQLQPNDDLSGTDALVVPQAPAPSASSSGRLVRYKVRRGDTLVTVADRFAVTVAQLRRWNHVRGSELEPGRSLYVAEPAHVPSGRARARRTQSARTHSRSATVARGGSGAHAAKTHAALRSHSERAALRSH